MKLFYVTFPDHDTAHRIGEHVVEERLAVCVTTTNVDSLYTWEDETVEDGEVVGLFKTSDENTEQLRTTLEEQHPYDTPCILTLPVNANQAYEEYVSAETQ